MSPCNDQTEPGRHSESRGKIADEDHRRLRDSRVHRKRWHGCCVPVPTLHTGLPAAVKTLRDRHEGAVEMRERFSRETAVLNDLKHPNIVSIYDSGIDAGAPWYAMELIDGAPLSARIQSLFADPVGIRPVFLQILGGLAYLHSQSILHRDLKPENVLISVQNYVKIVDF